MQKRKQLEAALTPQQRIAAQMIVDNEWSPVLNGGKKKTNDELAAEIGIGRSQFYEWKKNDDFIAYVNYLTDKQLESMRSEVNVAIMKLINPSGDRIPSVKALDLYMRRFALLTDRTVVEDHRSAASEHRIKTDEEIAKDLAELDRMINGEITPH
ncbi:phBC6A51 family helix-turn-helix protein [Paenibacillus sp.]|uniref:phBC6A51 family helix-turn-helix protein n=1 Tax=Paenibacillus sp. TaxID=58172 RepID=UPI002D229EA7|nr:phBC6A51 family helix-turn-helix protein [Paenibacillus sp.]HZG87309.1 phBC6A51 family helix-turn-helix protein [Paenibacillus sp.]